MEELGQPQPLAIDAQILLVDRARDLVDGAAQPIRVDHRQVVPQLRALAEDHADLPRLPPPVLIRYQPVDPHRALGGTEHPGHHLDRGGLAGAVRPDQTEADARLDRERYLPRGLDATVLAAHHAARPAGQRALVGGDLEGLAQALGDDDR
jgi:hypothetical protein